MQTRQANYVAEVIGLIGIGMGAGIAMIAPSSDMNLLWFDWWGLIIFAGTSAWIAGKLCWRFFGRPGAAGWSVAALGAILTTTCGAMIAGTFVMPFVGTLLAPLMVFAYMIFFPALGLVWLFAMIGLHHIAMKSNT